MALTFLAIVLVGCSKPNEYQESKITETTATPYVTMAQINGKVNYPGKKYMLVHIGRSPDLSDAMHYEMTQNDEYSFSYIVKGLQENTTYYYQVEAGNVNFVLNSEIRQFKTAVFGVFSVDEFRKVRFSKGNLQYQASSNIWRFAEHQWDFVGGTEMSYLWEPIDEHGNVYENGEKCKNELMSSSYSGWIDLFGWGTSGYNHGAVCYQPWSTSSNCSDYYAYGSPEYHLYDRTGKADWGINQISTDSSFSRQWRTMSVEEWNYVLMNSRMANVHGINGVVVLPDFFLEENAFNLSNDEDYNANVISDEDWTNHFESYGAAFLPAAGMLEKYHRLEFETGWWYWSASAEDEPSDSVFVMLPSVFYNNGHDYWERRYLGCSVRLVQDVK